LDAFCQPQTKTFGIVCSTDEIGLLTLCIPITYIVIVDLLIVRVKSVDNIFRQVACLEQVQFN